MRQAQRTYRVKKEDTLRTATNRSAKLEGALRGMLDSFRNFQQTLVDEANAGAVPPQLALQISKAAIEIASISQGSGLESAGPAAAAETSSPDTMTTAAASPEEPRHVAERFAKASMQRTADALSSGNPDESCLPPALLKQLKLDPAQLLLAQTLGQLSASSSSLLRDIPYSNSVTSVLPLLFRLNQGDTSHLIPRKPPPMLQRLKHGLTRTIVATDLPELMGEWLEPVDVEEYLAQRGIFVRDAASDGNLINLQMPALPEAAPTIHYQHPDTQPSDLDLFQSTEDWLEGSHAVGGSFDFTLDWTIFGCQKDETQIIPSGFRTFTPPSTYLSDFDSSPSASGSEMRTPETAQDSSTITISVNKLIDSLASKATCLGPGPGVRREDVDEAIRDAVVRQP